MLRTLNIPAEGAVEEGKLFAYKLSLSAVPSESVKIQLTMQGDCTLLTLSLNLHDTTETIVTIKTPNNFVDEGDNVIAYTCNISHTLNSTDSAYHGQVHMIQLSVLDDDVADVKVAAYSPDLHGFLSGVNKLGPLCLDEGKNITYGIVLESQPTDVVLIGAKIEHSRDDSPLKLRPPVLLHIHPSEWNITHSMHLASVHDFIDNDVLVEDFEVYHFVQTNDAVFHNTTKYPTASFQVTDHPLDVAGLKYTPAANIIRLNENSEYIITARLNCALAKM